VIIMMMRATSLFVASSLFFLPSLVSAHGYISEMTIGGKTYEGNNPYSMSPHASPLRMINAVEPVKLGVDDENLVCGKGAKAGTDVAEVKAGSEIKIKWVAGDGKGKWIHNKGPVMTYMASCGDTPCSDFDATKAKWFKTEEKGVKPDGKTWYQGDIYDGQLATTTVPAELAPGNYLLRHELIALHLGSQVGGAEFFINCAQLKVTGSGTGKPSGDELVKIPGLYTPKEPGIFFEIDQVPMPKFTFPGPPLSKLAGSSSSDSGSSSGGSSSHSGSDDSGSDDSESGSESHSSKGPKPTSAKPSSGSKPTAASHHSSAPNLAASPTSTKTSQGAASTATRSCSAKRQARRDAMQKRSEDVAAAAIAAQNETVAKTQVKNVKRQHNHRRRMHGGVSRFSV
jgi:hypothetical protein